MITISRVYDRGHTLPEAGPIHLHKHLTAIPIMSVIIILLIGSLSVAGLFLGLFIWSVRNRQFEDDYSPPLRILFDDGPAIVHDTDPKPTNQ